MTKQFPRLAQNWSAPIFSALVAVLLILASAVSVCAQTSTWVFVGPGDKLVYKTDGLGNHIMDFSHAGYKGGGVALPVAPVKVTISPVAGDNTSHIQSAINSVAAMAPDANGIRGAVLLNPGTYNISATLHLGASGVVLRGSGSGAGGTVIHSTASLAISVAGSGTYATSHSVNITDSFVHSGDDTITVSSAAGFAVGDTVVVARPVTAAWVHEVGMDHLVRGGRHETWIPVGTHILTDRAIAAISGNTITLDAPLTDSFDSRFLGTPVGTLSKYTFAGRISETGVEHLRITVPTGATVFSAVHMSAVINSWISDVVSQDTQNAFDVSTTGKQITLTHVINNVSTTQTRAAGTADFDITGTEVLVDQCQSNGTGDWPIVTAAEGTGPIVALNFTSTQHAGISPHQRWTTGILADSCSFPNAPAHTPGVAFSNRGVFGSGQGWDTAWSVAWNVNTPNTLVSQAPGTENWCIGCTGTIQVSSDPQGTYDSHGTHVIPSSLYLAQLCERLGPGAAANIGYSCPALH